MTPIHKETLEEVEKEIFRLTRELEQAQKLICSYENLVSTLYEKIKSLTKTN
tara:strand:+ start:1381 stop:1536 length:156 start_codon:yes stop_codon:yes gene_type:complete